MAQSLNLKIKGLYTHPSDLSEVPEGALSVADNIVINKESTAEPRRGFDLLRHGSSVPSEFSDPSYRANKLFFYKDARLCHYGSNLLAYHDETLGWVDYTGTFAPPSADVRVRDAAANQNFYFTTATGVFKLDALAGTPMLAGAPRGLDIQASTTGSSGFLSDKYRVAYRVVWGFRDANDNLVLGAPSQLESVKNGAGGARNISLTFTVPAAIAAATNGTSWLYQVYRTKSVDNTAADIEPADVLGLVCEGNPTLADLSAKTVTVTDITPDELRGADLYTNQGQQGITSGNLQPPLCKDIAVFRDSLFFGNVTDKHRYTLTLLAVGGTSGIAANDTVTIGGVVYTGKASETIGSREFAVVTGGSVGQNIKNTSISLIRVINRAATSTVYASYLSGSEDLPGMILLEERSIGGASFPLVSSRATCWSPALPTSGTSESSSNDASLNGLYCSKTFQPEAVPLTNRWFVGSKDKKILRIIPLREKLIVLKEDGAFQVAGYDPLTFAVSPLDSTAIVLAPETAQVFNNQIFCLSTQGVEAISDNSPQVVSRPIETTLLELQGVGLDTLREVSFGVSYESERKYVLFVPSSAGDTTPTQAYVYNTFTNTWTRWPLSQTCGGVDPADDKMYLGDASRAFVSQERKAFRYTDFVDFRLASVISDITGRVLTIASADLVHVGDVISQTASIFSIVESVDAVAGTVTVSSSAPFTLAACDVLASVATRVAWVPQTLGNPGIMKQFFEAAPIFRSDFYGTAELVFTSDISASPEAETLVGTAIGGFGLFPWGSVPWGGGSKRRPPYRVTVPRNKQRCTQLIIEFRHSTGYARWQLLGISLQANPGTSRTGRA